MPEVEKFDLNYLRIKIKMYIVLLGFFMCYLSIGNVNANFEASKTDNRRYILELMEYKSVQ